MQNKANFTKSQMNVNKVLSMDYENKTLGGNGKNKANSKPNEPKTNPIKANLLNAQMNVNKVITEEYEKMSNWVLYENEPNSNPIKANTKPIQTQTNPTCSEPACPEPACPEHRRRVEGVEPISKAKYGTK